MCVRQMRPPGRGDFWILKIAHAPSPKNLSKNGFCPRKGVAFLWKAFLQKIFRCGRRFRVIQRKLRHGAHPVLQWCAANAVVTRDPAGECKFDRAKSTGRIDALVALAMALSLALLRAEKQIDIRVRIGERLTARTHRLRLLGNHGLMSTQPTSSTKATCQKFAFCHFTSLH